MSVSCRLTATITFAGASPGKSKTRKKLGSVLRASCSIRGAREFFCRNGGMSPTGNARPLSGLRIVVTRAEIQSQDLTARLREEGATVLLLPAIQFASPEDCAPL